VRKNNRNEHVLSWCDSVQYLPSGTRVECVFSILGERILYRVVVVKRIPLRCAVSNKGREGSGRRCVYAT
jgi:hypothetical protein